jgi:hypothetical protein
VARTRRLAARSPGILGSARIPEAAARGAKTRFEFSLRGVGRVPRFAIVVPAGLAHETAAGFFARDSERKASRSVSTVGARVQTGEVVGLGT